MSRLKINRRLDNNDVKEQPGIKKPKVKKKGKAAGEEKESLPVFAKAHGPDGGERSGGGKSGSRTGEPADSNAGMFKPSEELTGSSVKPAKKVKLDKKEKKKPVPKEAASSPAVHKRRIRLAEEEKTATAEDVNEAVKTSIFAGPESYELDRDYIIPTEGSTEGFLAGYSDYDEYGGVEEKPLKLAKEIADAFGIKEIIEPDELEETPSIFAMSEEEPEDELEEEPVAEPEEEPAIEPEEGAVDVLGRLVEVSSVYFSGHTFAGEGKCILVYSDESVDSIIITEDLNIQLPTYRVYVNGRLQEWDRLFEVKIPAGSLVEVETGVRLSVPGLVKVKLSASEDLMDKYSLEHIDDDRILSEDELKEPVVMSFRACEGAYLSKVGRVIECQLGE